MFQKKIIVTILLIDIIILAVVTCSSPESNSPVVFRNKQDALNYIKSINDHYGIIGRPRFGKRISHFRFGKRNRGDEKRLFEENDSTSASNSNEIYKK
jgi:hypothetical protein